MIVIKISDSTTYLLHGGKLVALATGTKSNPSVPKLYVNDTSWADILTAFGPVVS